VSAPRGTTRRRTTRPRRPRRGFTLVELIVAVALMGGVLLSFAAFAQRMGHANGVSGQRTAMSDLVVERLEKVKSLGDYATLDTTAVTESNLGTGYAGYVRQTYVRRTLTTSADHKTVTVVVRIPALKDSVVKTTVIPAF
jgi:prepilin-type N-terminal cleavage/methylation domain-containing protein